MSKTVIIETSMGVIEMELDSEKAPITVKNFLNYVSKGYYDGTIFHRVISNFMIQGGGFLPDGSQKDTHAPIKLESGNGLSNEKGTVAMARTNIPDSATSQFFINTKDNIFLNRADGPGQEGYAVFGKVTKGMDVVNQIKEIKTGDKGFHSDWPVTDIVIEKLYVKE